MILFWALIATFEILTANAQSVCKAMKGHGSGIFEESSNGYCFFILPRSLYIDTMYEKQADGNYRLLFENTDRICHGYKAAVLTGDYYYPILPKSEGPAQIIADAARKLRERFDGILFAGCGNVLRERDGNRRGRPCNIGEKPEEEEVMLSFSKQYTLFTTTQQIWRSEELPALACFQYQPPGPVATALQLTPTTTPGAAISTTAPARNPQVTTRLKAKRTAIVATTTTAEPTLSSIPSQNTTTPPKPIVATKTKPKPLPKPVKNACNSGKYENVEETEGFCFFEPPEHEYLQQINEVIKGTGNYHFNLVKARKICEKHKAKLLRWDISEDGPVTKAIIKLKKKLGDLDVPVDCFVEPDTSNVNCDRGPAVATASTYAFISHEDKFYTWSQRAYYPKYLSGLICHTYPTTAARS